MKVLNMHAPNLKMQKLKLAALVLTKTEFAELEGTVKSSHQVPYIGNLVSQLHAPSRWGSHARIGIACTPKGFHQLLQVLVEFIDKCFAHIIESEDTEKEAIDACKEQEKDITAASAAAEHHVIGIKALLARVKAALS